MPPPEGVAEPLEESAPDMGPSASDDSGISLAFEAPDAAIETADAPVAPEAAVPPANSGDDIALSLDDGGDLQLDSGTAAAPPPEAEAPPSEAAPEGASLELSTDDSPPPAAVTDAPTASKLQVIPAKKGERRSIERINAWSREMLNGSKDAVGTGLRELLASGASSGVYLVMKAPEQGAKAPSFAASGGHGKRPQLRVWTGLKWKPDSTPELWNEFVKNGFFELEPSRGSTDPGSARSELRRALGAEASQWISVYRVGPADACKGAIVVYSGKSLKGADTKARETLQTPEKKAA